MSTLSAVAGRSSSDDPEGRFPREGETPSSVRRAAMILSAPILFYLVLYAVWPTARGFLADDAYYYFTIARNIADGSGSTFDRLNPTNGYHPLWCVLLTTLALFPMSKGAFLVAALTLQGGLVTLAVLVLFGTNLRPRAPAPRRVAIAVTVLWMANFYVSKTLLNGLESGLLVATSALLLLSASARVASLRHQDMAAGFGVGLWSGLVLLSRVDAFFLPAAVLIVWTAARRHRLAREWPAIVAIILVPVVTLFLYLLANRLLFGVFLPVSGHVKRFMVAPGPSVRSVAACALVCGAILGAHRLAAGRWVDFSSRSLTAYSMLTLAVLLFELDSMLVRGVVVPEIWYLSQHALWVLATLWLMLRRYPRQRRLQTGVLAALSLGVVASWALRLQPRSYEIYERRRQMAEWINANLPEESVIAGWDVGMLGYHCDLPVINLDGLVNSPEYIGVMERKEGIAYLDKMGVTHLAQYYQAGFARFRPAGFDAEELHRRGESLLWHRESPSTLLSGIESATLQVEVREYRRPEIAVTGGGPPPSQPR